MGRGDRAAGGVNLDVALAGRPAHGSAVEVGGVAAVVHWLGGRFHQLRLSAPLPGVQRGSRVPVRAGTHLEDALVLDPDAPRHGPDNDLLVRLARLLEHGADPVPTPSDPPPAPPPLGRAPAPPPPGAGPAPDRPPGPGPAPDRSARRRAARIPLSADAVALEAHVRAAGLHGLAVEGDVAALLGELRAHQRVTEVAGTFVHCDHLDELYDEVADLGSREPELVARALRLPAERVVALLAALDA